MKTCELTQIIDQDKMFLEIFESCKNFTMTSKERMYALYKATRQVIECSVPGDFVECGVWKGGSAMIIAYSLIGLNATDRKIYLYDTFEGMTEPKECDFRAWDNTRAWNEWNDKQKLNYNDWCYAPMNEVKSNMTSTGYPEENIIYVKGKVEETIPKRAPAEIAILRLDTDWYESTMHELIHLYPLLSKNGVLIIDDYGYWAGSKKATDEYFSNFKIVFNRIDDTGIIAIKP
ncbi:TylF/MycF family methyltransferase [Patescibacteria group bacterium]|nr:TylF/MycF family methyltransferase [Patescibacteria group bacterium]